MSGEVVNVRLPIEYSEDPSNRMIRTKNGFVEGALMCIADEHHNELKPIAERRLNRKRASKRLDRSKTSVLCGPHSLSNKELASSKFLVTISTVEAMGVWRETIKGSDRWKIGITPPNTLICAPGPIDRKTSTLCAKRIDRPLSD